MKKLLLLITMFAPLFFASCGDDDDEQSAEKTEQQPVFTTYNFKVTNNINPYKVNGSLTDGKLYEVYAILCSGKEYKSLGTIGSGEIKTSSFKLKAESTKEFFVVFKFLPTRGGDLKSQKFHSFEGALGKIMRHRLITSGTINAMFDEDSKYLTFPYTDIQDIINLGAQ